MIFDSQEDLTPEQIAEAAQAAKKAAKAAKRAEKKRLKALAVLEAAKQLKRDELGREMGLTALIYQEHAAEWEEAMAGVKQESLKKELDALWADVRHIVDRKNNLIERLSVDRERAREQIRTSAMHHLQFLDHSKELFQSFAKALKNMYEAELETDLSEFRDHYVWKKKCTTKRKFFFENLMLGTNTMFDNNLANLDFLFSREKSDFIDTDIANREAIRDSIQNSMERLFGQMKKIVDETRRTSMAPDRLKTYMKLVAREREDTEGFTNIQKDTIKSVALIEKLTEQRCQLEEKTMKSLSEMKKEKEYFMECYAILRDRYESDMKLDQSRMRFLMDKTYTTITFLKEIEKRGGLILAVSAVIRKFQTEKEKVLPWPEHFHLSKNESAMTVADQMEPLWMQISAVNAQNLALIEEKRTLELENEQLRETIRRYCKQEKYERCIRTLKISTKPTVSLPAQEAAHILQLNPFSKLK